MFALTISCPAPGGTKSFALTVEQAERYSANPIAIAAEVNGVSVEQYTGWLSSGFNVECSARTSKGKRCKKIALNGYWVDAVTWVEMQGSYCGYHAQ